MSHWVPQLLGCARTTPHQNPCPTTSHPLGSVRPQLRMGQLDPCPAWISASWGVPDSCPFWTSASQAALDPCPAGTISPWVPHPSGFAGPQLHVGLLEPCKAGIPTPQGQAAAWHEKTASPSRPGSPPIGQSQARALQAFQITAPPGSHLGLH
jgi:hypothetical protein